MLPYKQGVWADLGQLLSQRSKTRTSLADSGSASGDTFQCMKFLPFLFVFSYLSYLGHPSLLGLQTKTRRWSNSSTFFLFKSHNPETSMHSTVNVFVHAICKRSRKCLMQKVARLDSSGWIAMIQPSICSSCVALQYETGTKFSRWVVPEYQNIWNFSTTAWCFSLSFWEVCQVPGWFTATGKQTSLLCLIWSFQEGSKANRGVVLYSWRMNLDNILVLNGDNT